MKRTIIAQALAAMLAFPGTAAVETAAESPREEQEQPLLVRITEDDPATAYVAVYAPQPIGLLPLPAEGEYTKTIRQEMPDGSQAYNTVRVTPEGFRMEEANCENHDCIEEGEVTLANREERILGGMVICLPHRLMLELVTREEAEKLLGM